MNSKAAVFASNFTAVLSIIAAVFFYSIYGWMGAVFGFISAIFWYSLGHLFKRSMKH